MTQREREGVKSFYDGKAAERHAIDDEAKK